MRNAALRGFINATDCADYLVKKGLPFRDAYTAVGKLVSRCIETGKTLETLELEEYRKLSPSFDADVFEAITLENLRFVKESCGRTCEGKRTKADGQHRKIFGGKAQPESLNPVCGSNMKKLCVILAAVFLLSVFQPCGAQESGTYATDIDQADGYIVKLKDSPSDAVSLMENTDLTEISSDAGLYHADSVLDIKELGDDVLYYEPDYKVTLAGIPNDAYASKQWSIDYLGISSAWDAGYNGQGVKIAVIDSGVNSTHEDFAGANFTPGFNVINNSQDVTDEMGHGTFVCGIFAAARNNEKGIAGFCTDATIIPIKCFGASKETSASYLVESIYVAVDDYHCDVINLSSGMPENVRSLEEAVNYAASKGVIVIASAGNDGNSNLNYPAAYDCVVGVGAVDQNGLVTSFSEKKPVRIRCRSRREDCKPKLQNQ